jgi:hypothetical protein
MWGYKCSEFQSNIEKTKQGRTKGHRNFFVKHLVRWKHIKLHHAQFQWHNKPKLHYWRRVCVSVTTMWDGVQEIYKGWIIMKKCWCDTEGIAWLFLFVCVGKPKYWEKTLSRNLSNHHEPHMIPENQIRAALEGSKCCSHSVTTWITRIVFSRSQSDICVSSRT